jgi:hypothetical protein
MSHRRMLVGLVALALAAPAVRPAPSGGAVSYKLDGKSYSFAGGRLECYKADGYVSLVAERTERIQDPSGAEGEIREVTVGMTIQLAKAESALVGEHRSNTPDEMPTHFSWCEIVLTEDKKGRMIKEYLAGLDDGDKTKMFIRLKIEAFGPAGSAVTGTFSGALFDEEGRLHEISDGVFSVPRRDMN